MPTPSLEKLKAQQAALTARIQQLESRHKVSERKKNLRRKILVGAYYLDQMDDEKGKEALKNGLDAYLTRNSDRSLFDLAALPEEKNRATQKQTEDSTP